MRPRDSFASCQTSAWRCYLAILLVQSSLLFTVPAFTQTRLEPCVALAQYQDANHTHYLDISYSLPEASLKQIPSSEGYAYDVGLDVQVFRDDSLWASKLWRIARNVTTSTQGNSRRQLVDVLHYVIDQPGRYRVLLHARDLNQPEMVDSAEARIDYRAFSSDRLELSDLICATEIKRAEAGGSSMFVKNSYEVIPNPRRIYGEGSPILYYYFESYNLIARVPGTSYKTYLLVKDASGRPIVGLGSPYRTKKKQNDSSVEIGMLSVASLPTGSYTLIFGIADSAQVLLQSREANFQVYNPAIARYRVGAAQAGGLADLSQMELADLDAEFERMQHIIRPEDKKFYQTLQNVGAKREYVTSLWQQRKPADEDADSYRELYLERAKLAEEQLGGGLRPGWKGDQGRVMILYGPPSHVERHSSDQATKPYEIWTYDDLEAGAVFVFADRTGFHNYELLHSTARGELQNPDWQRLIVQGGDSFR